MNDVEQVYILDATNSAYFIGIMIGQWFNLFMVKSVYTYPSKIQLQYNLYYQFHIYIILI